MARPIHVMGISGSLRRASWNSGLLRAAGELLPEGMSLEIFDLAPLPFYNQDLDTSEALPDAVRQLRERIRAADALLMATPEYNYSVTAVLKNAIDWAARPPQTQPLAGKPLAIMGAGGLFGTVRAQLHLRQIAVFTDMLPLNKPEVRIMRGWEKFDADGNLTDEPSRQEVRALVEALAVWTRRLRRE
jgi:chromate reductase, NAD(P)H dehydrogenase (quinone)